MHPKLRLFIKKTNFMFSIITSIILLSITSFLFTRKFSIPLITNSSYIYEHSTNIAIANNYLNNTISNDYLHHTIPNPINIKTVSDLCKSSNNNSQIDKIKNDNFYQNSQFIEIFEQIKCMLDNNLSMDIITTVLSQNPKISKNILYYLHSANINDINNYLDDFSNIKKLFTNYNTDIFKMNDNNITLLSELDNEINNYLNTEITHEIKELKYEDYKIKFTGEISIKKCMKFSITSKNGLKYGLIRLFITKNKENFTDLEFDDKINFFEIFSANYLRIIFKVKKLDTIWYFTEDYDKEYDIHIDKEYQQLVNITTENSYDGLEQLGYEVHKNFNDNVVLKRRSFNQPTDLVPKILNLGFYKITTN